MSDSVGFCERMLTKAVNDGNAPRQLGHILGQPYPKISTPKLIIEQTFFTPKNK